MEISVIKYGINPISPPIERELISSFTWIQEILLLLQLFEINFLAFWLTASQICMHSFKLRIHRILGRLTELHFFLLYQISHLNVSWQFYNKFWSVWYCRWMFPFITWRKNTLYLASFYARKRRWNKITDPMCKKIALPMLEKIINFKTLIPQDMSHYNTTNHGVLSPIRLNLKP